MSQLGMSIGIAVLAVISNSITDGSHSRDKESPHALLQGYRAVFWTCFAMMVLSTIVGAWGLRGWNEIGASKDKENSTSGASSSTELMLGEKTRSRPSTSITSNTSSISDLTDKPLPALPVIRVTEIEGLKTSLDIEAGPSLEYILGLYNRSQLSMIEEQEHRII